MASPPRAAALPSPWVVAACFNEAAGIRDFIAAIEALGMAERLLLIDDGSRDNTATLIRSAIEARRISPRRC